MARIGFIGLGSMGWPMAARLAVAGETLIVADADATRVREFADAFGAHVEISYRKLAEKSDIVITMLPTSGIVLQVFEGEEGVLAGLSKTTLALEMSSGEPHATRRLAEHVLAVGAGMVDAPVSGGVARAEAGQLAIMVGGADRLIDIAMPILKHMGNKITRTGAVGSAHAMKAINNLLSAVGFMASIEALVIGKKFGLDPSVMVDVLNGSSGMNNSTQNKIKQFVLSRSFDSGFSLDLMVKDLGIALSVAHEGKAPVPLSALCLELWRAAASMGLGGDHTAAAKLPEHFAGVELGVNPV